MYKEKSAKEKFFATFTHDIKTALFRLQLQIEKLGQAAGEEAISPVLVHTRKIHLDLENGLDSTIGQKKELYVEQIGFKNFVSELHTQWPEFHIKLSGDDSEVLADRKALHSIFKNLLHNSFFHGEADKVLIELENKTKKVRCTYSDNGKKFEGDKETLGLQPQASTQSSGFGLYIVRYWVEKMGGQLNFLLSEAGGLKIQIDLPQGDTL
ncbi:MAG: HAMP domain-containing histidine kinase [Bdellovibrionales bacterium]|nr:HAMP domain-containing histidine kinase [Bdellovibrionales bacterium]